MNSIRKLANSSLTAGLVIPLPRAVAVSAAGMASAAV
jgi:hypothetical protein